MNHIINIFLLMFVGIILNLLCESRFVNSFLKPNKINNFELDTIKAGCVSWDAKKEKKLWPTAYEIRNLINDLIKKNKNLKIIILPESTFPFFLNKYPEVVSFWFDNINFMEKESDIDQVLKLGNLSTLENNLTQTKVEKSGIKAKSKIDIIIGSHRYENGKIYNTCYWLSEGVIKKFYDKNHGLFFAERLPTWAKKLRIKNLILKNSKEIDQKQNDYKIFKIDNFNFLPLICSEIFFEKNLINKKDILTLALINDAWCKNNFFSNILFLCAVLQACDCCNDILYISHKKNIFIDSLCNLKNL